MSLGWHLRTQWHEILGALPEEEIIDPCTYGGRFRVTIASVTGTNCKCTVLTGFAISGFDEDVSDDGRNMRIENYFLP